MEENVASIFETVKTLVDLLHNQRVIHRNLYSRNFAVLFKAGIVLHTNCLSVNDFEVVI